MLDFTESPNSDITVARKNLIETLEFLRKNNTVFSSHEIA